MATHKALIHTSHNDQPSLQHVPVPEATAGSAVVRVLSLGVVKYIKRILQEYPLEFPLTLGSNVVGRVEAVGPDAVALKPGQLVYCDCYVRARDEPGVGMLQGIAARGPAATLMKGEWRHGAIAELVKSPLENVYALDEERLFGQLGYSLSDLMWMATCVIPFGGLSDINLAAGETIIVAPATGGFGSGAVYLALAQGATVIAAGRNQETLKTMMAQLGGSGRLTTVALSGDHDTDAKAFAAAAGGKPVDALFDISPPEATGSYISAAMQVMGFGSRISIMGGIRSDVPLSLLEVMRKNMRIQGRWMYERRDVLRLIKMTESGVLRMDAASTGQKTLKFSLDEFAAAIDAADEMQGYGTMVTINP